MKTSNIKQIIAKDPNAIFVIKQRFGRGTSYGSITEVIEREVPVYDNYRQTGTRIEFIFAVSHHTYSRGYLRSEGDYSDQVPAYGLATRKVSAREIQSHMAHWEATTIQEWVAQEDADAKARHQEKIERAGSKQQVVNGIIRHISSPTVTDAEWNKLNNDLMGLRIETLQLISEKITSRV
jgi:hypothetical protein